MEDQQPSGEPKVSHATESTVPFQAHHADVSRHDSSAETGKKDLNTEEENAVGFDEEKQPSSTPEFVRPITGIRWFLVVLCTLGSSMLYALDNTIVADITPAIINRLGQDEKAPWISVAFFLGGVSTIFVAGNLYLVFDAKWMFIGCTILFMVGSALCGAAPTMDAEIVGRVLAGIGGNAMFIGTLLILSVNTTEKERPAYVGLTGLVWGISTILGPIIGGALELYNWRFAFYINLFVGAVLAPVYLFLIPRWDPKKHNSHAPNLLNLDWIGMVLNIGAFVSVLMLINFGGTVYGWGSGSMIALYIIAPLCWIALFGQQIFCLGTDAMRRVLPLDLILRKEPAVIGTAFGSSSGSFFIPVYYIPLYFQFTRGDSAILAGVRLLPLVITFVFAVIVSGAVGLPKFPRYKWYLIISNIIALPGLVMLSVINEHTSRGYIYGASVLVGIGVGITGQNPMSIIQGILPTEKDRHNGRVVMQVAQIGGATFALGIAGAVFTNTGLENLRKLLSGVPKSQIQGILIGTSGNLLKTLSPAVQEEVVKILIDALRKTFIVAYVATAVALLCGLFTKDQTMFLYEGERAIVDDVGEV